MRHYLAVLALAIVVPVQALPVVTVSFADSDGNPVEPLPGDDLLYPAEPYLNGIDGDLVVTFMADAAGKPTDYECNDEADEDLCYGAAAVLEEQVRFPETMLATLVNATFSFRLSDNEEVLQLFRQADTALQEERYADACRLFERVLGIEYNLVPAFFGLTRCRGEAGNYPGALSAFDQVIRFFPESGHVYYARATLHYDQERYARAMADVVRAIELMPDTWEALALRHRIAHATGDTIRALSAVTRALLLSPDNAFLFLERASFYRDTKAYRLAESDYFRAIQLEADNPHSHNGLANLYFDQEKFEKALTAYRRSLELDPSDIDVKVRIGDSLRQLKRLDEALEAYGEVKEADPENLSILNNFGWTYLLNHNYRQAIDYFDRGLEAEPDKPRLLNNRGTARYLAGQYELALVDFEHLLTLYAEQNKFGAYTVAGKARCLIAIGRGSEAVDLLVELVERAPDYFDGFYEFTHGDGNHLGTIIDEFLAAEPPPNADAEKIRRLRQFRESETQPESPPTGAGDNV